MSVTRTLIPRTLLRSRWFRSGIGFVGLAVIIWFLGPLIGIGQAHPLDSDIVRMIVIGLLAVLWVVINLVQMLQAARHEKDLIDDVAKAEPNEVATASAAELDVLAKRLREALHTLKRAKLGGGKKLYQLPWYMFIGPPGAGKTTALANCGLRFPLAETDGPGAIAGVGGTANCEWWFTDEAVMIDTAGRYTTQDSHKPVDEAAWQGFLRLLKRHRGRQPLNGVLLTISLADLSTLDDARRGEHARAMRKRVAELTDILGVRIPIYVLLTKADLLAGFSEFFDNMSREEREQVWGTTLPLDDGKSAGGAVANFAPAFDALLGRLNERMLERVDQETDLQRRRLIFGFPQQIASLRDTIADFLADIFKPSKLEARPLLRGVYFTSGTQDGTPIDRLLGGMAQQFGLPRQTVTAFSGTGRSYFLARLIREVVFGEAGLVSTDPKLEARARWTYRAAYGGAALCLVLLSAFWTVSFIGNQGMIADAHATAARYREEVRVLVGRGAQDTDLQAILPPLDSLRNFRGGYADREAAPPLTLTFGLYQGTKITTAAVDAYARALNAFLLPRMLARLEGQLQAHLDKPDFLYEALKVYLILGRQGPMDADLVQHWMQLDLNANFPGDENADLRGKLADHLAAMLERPLAAVPLDGDLISRVRGLLTQEPLAVYSYNRMLRSHRARELPEWTVGDNAGAEASRVLTLRSHRPLSAGVSGIFTHSGYHSVFLPLLSTVTQDITEDGWVLGLPDRGISATLSATTKLRRDVLGLYLDDYTRQWDALIADVALKPFANLASAVDELNLLSAPDSPLRNILQSLDSQTQLSRAGATSAAAAQAQSAATKVASRAAGLAGVEARAGLTSQENEIANALGEAFGADQGGKPVDPASRVDAHFAWIHDFVAGKDGQPPELDAALVKIQAMYQNFNQVAGAANPGAALLQQAAGGGGGTGGGGSPAAQLATMTKTLPKPIAAMLQTVSESGSAVASNGASQSLSDAWKSKVLPLCQAAFNRYPFVAASSADVPLDDFAHLLGPGGLMDAFFNDNLKSLVDTTQTPWRWQSADHASLGLSQETLVEFQRAAAIRDALYPGGTQMQVRFQLVPVALDSKLARATLDIAGHAMTYDHGPTQSAGFTWPAADGRTLVRVTLTSAAGGGETVIEKDGPWSLLRLLDASRVIPSGEPDQFKLIFSAGSATATFQVNASSVRNPFTLGAFRAFRCPAHL
jgi:type VI secretion system protein ImpL